MFKCKWVENQRRVKVDNDATQAAQVFYVEVPKDSRNHIVMHSKRHIIGVDNVVDAEEYNQFDELPHFL
ncbi:hypothetical protein LXL04_034951 [Taraxacum kok-saghyz]